MPHPLLKGEDVDAIPVACRIEGGVSDGHFKMCSREWSFGRVAECSRTK